MLLLIVLSHVYRKEQLINNIQLTFPGLFSETLKKNGSQDALAFAGEQAVTYHQLSRRIDAMIAMLEQMGVKPGDRVAILSVNMPNWAITYFGITFMGAVAVPILPDFSVRESRNILEHSGAKALVVSEKLSDNISDLQSENCRNIIQMDDFAIISGDGKLLFDSDRKPQKKYRVQEDDLASIIYTSGTTGQSKGVMLSHKNICSNAIAGGKVQPIDSKDRFLSVLPLSHTYENTLGLILPMIFGASIHYLREKPVAAVMIPAMKAVRPTMMLTVPLIIEKIYRSKIKPALTGSFVMKLLYAVPLMRRQMQLKAGKKLMETFGGKLKFFGIGGARLNREVEQFLIGAKFPYAIGYGLTESSPLLAGLGPAQCRLQSTGPAVDGVEIQINDPDPATGIGEIWAKGPGIMQGYYRNPEETKKTLSPDGWLKTGDLGLFDQDDFLFIKGRSKNVIVGANGENVYPEEIESMINNFRHVAESIVTHEKGKLVALVHFNLAELEKMYQHFQEEISQHLEDKLTELKEELLDYINSRVNRFSRLSAIVLHNEPFQKTPTQKIKRFLYT